MASGSGGTHDFWSGNEQGQNSFFDASTSPTGDGDNKKALKKVIKNTQDASNQVINITRKLNRAVQSSSKNTIDAVETVATTAMSNIKATAQSAADQVKAQETAGRTAGRRSRQQQTQEAQRNNQNRGRQRQQQRQHENIMLNNERSFLAKRLELNREHVEKEEKRRDLIKDKASQHIKGTAEQIGGKFIEHGGEHLGTAVAVVGELGMAFKMMAPQLAILAGAGAALVAIVKNIWDTDAATRDWMKALATANQAGGPIDNWNKGLNSIKSVTFQTADEIKEMADAALDMGLMMTSVGDHRMSAFIEQLGLAREMMNLSNESATEFGRILMSNGASYRQLGTEMDYAYIEMQKLNLTTKDMEASFAEADHSWHQLGGKWAMGVEKLRKGLTETRWVFKSFGMDANKSGEAVKSMLGNVDERIKQTNFLSQVSGRSAADLWAEQEMDPAMAEKNKLKYGAEFMLRQQGEDAGMGIEDYLKKYGNTEQAKEQYRQRGIGKAYMQSIMGDQYSDEEQTGIQTLLNGMRKGGWLSSGGNIDDKLENVMQSMLKQNSNEGPMKHLMEGYKQGIARTPAEAAKQMGNQMDSLVRNMTELVHHWVPDIIGAVYDVLDWFQGIPLFGGKSHSAKDKLSELAAWKKRDSSGSSGEASAVAKMGDTLISNSYKGTIDGGFDEIKGMKNPYLKGALKAAPGVGGTFNIPDHSHDPNIAANAGAFGNGPAMPRSGFVAPPLSSSANAALDRYMKSQGLAGRKKIAPDFMKNASLVGKIASTMGVDPAVAIATMWQESGGDAGVFGDAKTGGSKGLFQLHHGGEGSYKGKDQKVHDFPDSLQYDPEWNTRRALSFFKKGKSGDPGQMAAAAQRPEKPGEYAQSINNLYGPAQQIWEQIQKQQQVGTSADAGSQTGPLLTQIASLLNQHVDQQKSIIQGQTREAGRNAPDQRKYQQNFSSGVC